MIFRHLSWWHFKQYCPAQNKQQPIYVYEWKCPLRSALTTNAVQRFTAWGTSLSQAEETLRFRFFSLYIQSAGDQQSPLRSFWSHCNVFFIVLYFLKTSNPEVFSKCSCPGHTKGQAKISRHTFTKTNKKRTSADISSVHGLLLLLFTWRSWAKNCPRARTGP